MNVRQFVQKNSIFGAITLTIFLISISSALTFYGRYQAEQFTQAKNQIEAAKAKINSIFVDMSELDKGVRGFMVLPDEQFLIPFNHTSKVFSANLDTLQTLLEAQNFPEMEQLHQSRRALQDYHALLERLINFIRQDNRAAAIEIYQKDPGYATWEVCHKFALMARAFEQEQYEQAKVHYDYYLDIASLMQVILLIVGIPTLVFVIYQIRKSEGARTQLFQDLSESRRAYLFNDEADNQLQDPQDTINYLITDLEKASCFVRGISQGDYTVSWEGITEGNRALNQDNLTGALMQMREQMKKVKQEDQQRLWSTEGLSKVAEITRQHQNDLQKLADSLLSYLVTYTQANQGSLFFSQEDEAGQPLLVLTACYAYDKKKHADKTAKVGQGLVGQTYLERKTLHLTQLPDQYVSITSGLGEATPTALLLVPMLFNEQVLGILEIASFEVFAPHQIAFLESVGEVIASAVATVRMNSQTRVLLEQSQEGTEALRAQEEEMRQNMEELQATQEEMQRKAQEYEAVIEEQQHKIQTLEQAK